MKEKERLIVTGLVALMLILWLGFPLHRSPRFAGSLWGGVFGVVGSLLMIVPLLYLFIKRIKRLKKKVLKWVSMRTLLSWHIYAGVLGPILVVIHSGHKYESTLGVVLTAMTLLVVVSGFVGRYLMNRFSQEIREKKKILSKLEAAYEQTATVLASEPERAQMLQPFSGFFGRILAGLFVHESNVEPIGTQSSQAVDPSTVLHLSESIADIEYAIKTHTTFKAWFGKWLKFHIWISFVLYGLMALHVWGAIHFGIRWFDPWKTSTSYYAHSTVQGVEAAAPLAAPPNEEQSAAAVDSFSRHFGQLFRKYWHEPIAIHGIRTTAFDYKGIANEVGQPGSDFFKARLALEQVAPDRLGGGNAEKTFWINAYNFGAMKLAAENYPVASITDSKISDGNPWGIRGVRVGTEQYALHQIENEILLKKFDDPRIVFAVSCAAVSCPDRTGDIFSADQLDRQLDDIVRGLLANTTKGLAIDRQLKTVTLSWIIKTDRRLFGDGGDNDLLNFVLRYAPSDVRDWIDANRSDIKIKYFEHDWGLNDTALADEKN
ncbi:MAG: DUF547 domain-containing protein [Planctomycetes bacterium]|nr:DUF547 domain-containing protein [Planctomycetota bacterium]